MSESFQLQVSEPSDPAELTPPPELKPGDQVTLEIDGEQVECTFAAFAAFDFDPNINPDVRYLIKTEPVKVVFAQGGEPIVTTQDGIPLRVAEAGQVIIQNKPDSANPEQPYIFGEEFQFPAEQKDEFLDKYEPLADRPGYYRKKAQPMAVIVVDQATAIRPSWDANSLMGTPAGGVVAEAGYTISPNSLRESYQFVDENGNPEPWDEPEPAQKRNSLVTPTLWLKRVLLKLTG